ncbi:MAG: DNA-directed RNA polymerase subunit omega [Vicinamibacterales bacterium]
MAESPRPTTRPKNSFEYVTIAAARARQLLEGCVPRVEGSPKLARRALQEVASGAIKRVDPTPAE